MLTPDYPSGSGTVRFVACDSKILRDNRYRDPTYRKHPVYLPPSYHREPGRRFPVVYGLSGYTGTGLHFFGPGTFTETIQDRLDRLIDQGMPELIFVGVDCMTYLGGSQYVNGAAGRYEDYLLEEVLPTVESDVRTTADRVGRGLVGKSSGGYGTFYLGMRHPDVFPALACHSGDMFFEQSVLGAVTTVVGEMDKYDGNEDQKIEAFLEAFQRARKRSHAQGHTLMMLACAAAYSPDHARPAGFALPFDLHTGAIHPDVWERWLTFDPLHMADAHADDLRAARLLFFDCGRRDPYALHLGARQLHQKLDLLKIAHRYEEFDDDHSGLQYRYDVSFPLMANALQS